MAYRDPKSKYCFAKRFIVSKFIIDKQYRYFEEGMDLQYLSTAQQVKLEMIFTPKPKQKVAGGSFSFDKVLVKAVTAHGIRMANREVKKVFLDTGEKKGSPQLELFSAKK